MLDTRIDIYRLEWRQVLIVRFSVFRYLMAIMVTLLQYTQGTICSTMSSARCHVGCPGRSGCMRCPKHWSQGLLRLTRSSRAKACTCNHYFSNYSCPISYQECWWISPFWMFSRPNFWHNCYFCDNWWMDYHCCLCWRFSLYFRCSGRDCFFAYCGSQTRRKCWGVSISCFPNYLLIWYFTGKIACQQAFPLLHLELGLHACVLLSVTKSAVCTQLLVALNVHTSSCSNYSSPCYYFQTLIGACHHY